MTYKVHLELLQIIDSEKGILPIGLDNSCDYHHHQLQQLDLFTGLEVIPEAMSATLLAANVPHSQLFFAHKKTRLRRVFL